MGSEPEPAAYLYEFRLTEDEYWTQRATIQHPTEFGYDDVDHVEYRNVRPLVEGDSDE